MASRRKLKKTINYVSTELMTEVYFRVLLSGKSDDAKVEALSVEIADLNDRFILRAGHPDGKNNSAIVKAYFRKLFSDWQNAVDAIIKKLDEL
ncbi:MAG: hypothetical protein RB289_12930 [Paludibacter sp.]|jgi:hypothetical protein|nr:hypothetical protein [Paludibacter sp.]